MIGSRPPFHIGQRMKPSQEGYDANIFYKYGRWAVTRGTVVNIDKFNCPVVQWDGRKGSSGYHPDFIDPVNRPTHQQRDVKP